MTADVEETGTVVNFSAIRRKTGVLPNGGQSVAYIAGFSNLNYLVM